MTKFKITEQFWELFPQAEIAVVLAKGIQNTEAHVADTRQEINELLENEQQRSNQIPDRRSVQRE